MNRALSPNKKSSDIHGNGKYKSSIMIRCPVGLELLKLREYVTKFDELLELRIVFWKDEVQKRVHEAFCRFQTEESAIEFLNASHRVEGKEVC